MVGSTRENSNPAIDEITRLFDRAIAHSLATAVGFDDLPPRTVQNILAERGFSEEETRTLLFAAGNAFAEIISNFMAQQAWLAERRHWRNQLHPGCHAHTQPTCMLHGEKR